MNGWYRSRFGSRYKSGRCDPRSPFFVGSNPEEVIFNFDWQKSAWKAAKLLEYHKAEQVDLAALGEATGILFESMEMLNEAVLHLDRIRKGKEDADLGVPKASDSHSPQSRDQDMSDDKRSDDQKEKKTNSALRGAASAVSNVTGSSDGTKDQDPKSSSKDSGIYVRITYGMAQSCHESGTGSAVAFQKPPQNVRHS